MGLDILDKINQALHGKADDVKLAHYIHQGAVLLLPSLQRDEAIGALCDALVQQGILGQKRAFFDSVLHREKIVSTGVGLGVAIPHAKTNFIEDFFIALGVVQGEGIAWDALDNKPVHLILLIGGPERAQNQYLHILSRLTEIIRDENLRKSIIEAKDTQEVLSYFEGY